MRGGCQDVNPFSGLIRTACETCSVLSFKRKLARLTEAQVGKPGGEGRGLLGGVVDGSNCLGGPE